jgi:cytochrome c-type biogenesis protein CcmH
MIGFWVVAALFAAGAGALMLRRAALAQASARTDDPSLEVYRRALAEIDDLAGRGLLPAEERRATRAEAARRLLRAADTAHTPFETGGRGVVPVLAAGLVAVASLVIYLAIGSPGLADQPFAASVAAWRADPEHASPAALAAALGDIARQRPGDLEPLRRLAAFDLSLGDADGAAHALRRTLAVAPGRADLSAMLGEVLVIKAHGAVDADARALFAAALRADPGQAAARYYLARAKIADGDVAGGLDQWRSLAASMPASDPRHDALAAEIAAVAASGRLPAAAEPAPPASAEIAGAIQRMVDGLAGRLRARPNDAAGWVRLVRAYAVLGETAQRDKALQTAGAHFAGRPDVLAALATAAKAAPGTGR